MLNTQSMEDGGEIENEKWVSCPKCGGSGEIELYRNTRGGVCFDCGGKGVVLNYQAKGIKDKMIESRKKYDEKKKIAFEISAEKDERISGRRNLIAQELNKNIFELRLQDADINILLKRDDFKRILKLAEHLNVKNGEELFGNNDDDNNGRFEEDEQTGRSRYVESKKTNSKNSNSSSTNKTNDPEKKVDSTGLNGQ
jgi:RecJ-like exonuclease